MPIEPIDLRLIDARASNVYEAIIAAGKKARKINDERKLEFNTILGTVPNATSDDDGEDLNNPAQAKLSMEFEKRNKPHIEGMKNLLNGEVEFQYKEQR